MNLLVPEVICLILKLGGMMVLIKAGFMSLCLSLEERMAIGGSLKRSARAVQLFGRLAELETHILRY